MPQTTRPVTNVTLFAIGLTAGGIACTFPRLLPFLTQSGSDVSIELFTTSFIAVAGVFSAMLGVAMIWMYRGTKEHTKNLFMSALALPAVLSGGINMTTVSASAEQQLSELNAQTQQLKQHLRDNNAIDSLELDSESFRTLDTSSVIPMLFGISNAQAADPAAQQIQADAGSVQFNVKSLDKRFVLVYGTATAETDIQQQMASLKEKNITNIKMIESNGQFYILDKDQQTETDALINAIEIKKKTDVAPKLVKLK